MKVVIVAKTRRGAGACIGGITESGTSVRLLPAGADQNPRSGMGFHVGEIWDVQWTPPPRLDPPHIENILIQKADRVGTCKELGEFVHKHMCPVHGAPENLFDGRLSFTSAGALYISAAGGLPSCSTMFWIPDKPLVISMEGRRIRYRYPTPDGGRTFVFVGFQEPLNRIPAGTLVRVSLAHWWRPPDRSDEELRCYAQLSGWLSEIVEIDMLQKTRTEPSESDAPSESQISNLAVTTLRQTFGFSDFLPLQREVISRVLQRKHTLVVMPTGSGKSLCYQLPAILLPRLTIVISPLIALMQDQTAQLALTGVPAACLNSQISHRDYTATMRAVRERRVRLLYVAPETLRRPEILLLLDHVAPSCIAIDEAHCISEWGHDFRPDYRALVELHDRFPNTVRLALTATATQHVRNDIGRLLSIPAGGHYIGSFDRPNLCLGAELRRKGLGQTIEFLAKHRGESGIIYCAKRKQVDEVCAELTTLGWACLPYHAGMDSVARRENQTRFTQDEVPIIVATIAFGMGIDKRNTRFVLHLHLPKNIENYYQEVGRAGRDNLPADCLLLYTLKDAAFYRRLIRQGAASERHGREERLNAMLSYAMTINCRRDLLLSYFSEKPGRTCGNCDNCSETNASHLDSLSKSLKNSGASAPSPDVAPHPGPAVCPDPVLLFKLKALRLRLAREAKRPAFCVFSNKTLEDMAKKFPMDLHDFMQIRGVGTTKAEKYGGVFLQTLREHYRAPKSSGNTMDSNAAAPSDRAGI